MRRAYLFLYDGVVGNREEMKAVLNRMSRVITWRFDIPNCFYVISQNSAQELYDEFISHNGTKEGSCLLSRRQIGKDRCCRTLGTC